MALDTTVGGEEADSYNTLDAIAAYAAAHGHSFAVSPSAPAEAAARVAAQWIDDTYRARFPGYKTNGRLQAREWPRAAATDANGDVIPSTEIPKQILRAHCEAAIREIAEPGSLSPDLERGGAIKRLKASSVEIEYDSGAIPQTQFVTIDAILSGLIGQRQSGYTARAVRG